MGRAVVARMNGDDYQFRFFWLKACGLLDPHTGVERVILEADAPKSLDDVVVLYRAGHADTSGTPLAADYYQVKFHVTAQGAITANSLMDPGFVNAKNVSFLKRAHEAYQSHSSPAGRRFFMYTCWEVHPDDVLAGIVSNQDGRIVWGKLAEGGPKSKTGKVRTAWKDHLGITDDAELCEFLKHLHFDRGHTLRELGERLNERARSVGLTPCSDAPTSPYDSLARDLLRRGTAELDKQSFEDLMKQHGLWDGGPRISPDRTPIAIRSRMRFAEDLDARIQRLCCVSDYFKDRRITDPKHWSEHVCPSVRAFMEKECRPGNKYLLHLEAHASIAFLAGHCLPSTAGCDVAVAQKSFSGGQTEWTIPAAIASATGCIWETTELSDEGSQVALVVSMTHDALPHARAFVHHHLPKVGRILSLRADPGPGFTAIGNGGHAAAIAQDISQRLRRDGIGASEDTAIHLFSAAPNALLFFLGRLASSTPCWKLYEYDLQGGTGGTYFPSFQLPAQVGLSGEEKALNILLERGH